MRIILTITLILSTVLLAQMTNVEFVPTSGEDQSLNIVMQTDTDVLGLQFELNYNPSEIIIDTIFSLIGDFPFTYVEEEKGLLKGFIFSVTGEPMLLADATAGLIEIGISSNNYSGYTNMSLDKLIIATHHGESIPYYTYPFKHFVVQPVLFQETIIMNTYPNPFQYSTQIDYSISESSFVELVIINLSDEIVYTLVSENIEPGTYSEIWNGVDQFGYFVDNSQYIIQLTANEVADTKIITKQR